MNLFPPYVFLGKTLQFDFVKLHSESCLNGDQENPHSVKSPSHGERSFSAEKTQGMAMSCRETIGDGEKAAASHGRDAGNAATPALGKMI